jgi:hypothetical protein
MGPVRSVGDELRTAYRSATLTPLNLDERKIMVRAGWTAGTVSHLKALADYAIAHRTMKYVEAAKYGGQYGVSLNERICGWFGWPAQSGIHDTCSLPVFLEWLAVVAGTPELVAGEHSGHAASLTTSQDWAALVKPWRGAGRWGPLAYAAGLDPVEAVERHAAGTLDAGELLLLAGLRGYILPTGLMSSLAEVRP